jgi:protein-S-isoprenylcysteine O-methyltransferase Ste14
MRWLELRIPPPVVTLAFALAMFGVARVAPTVSFTVSGSLAIAVVLAVLGVAVALAGVVAFRRVDTTINPMTPGATSAIVSTGIYRYTRNPMYLGLLFALTGWAVCLTNAAVALLLPAFVVYLNQFQIKPEERALLAKFGPQFAQYTSRVRRWV